MQPAKHKFTIFKQIVEMIPSYLVPKLARKHDVEKRAEHFQHGVMLFQCFCSPVTCFES